MDNWYLAHLQNVHQNSSASDLEILTEDGMLSLAVVLASSLSIVGIITAFTTLSLFSDLRSVAGTTMMNLLASLFLTQLLHVVGAGGVQAADLCVSLALALHYSRLSTLCWLLAATHDLYRSVKNQVGLIDCPPSSLLSSFLKYSVLGWGFPALLLGLATVSQNYDGGMGESGAANLRPHNCWFTSNKTFLCTLFFPACFIMGVIVYYLVRATFAIRWTAAFAPTRKVQEKLIRRRKLQLMLFVRILLLFAMVTLAAAGSVMFDWHLAWVIFACGSALQGIFIALAVICNCQVLKLYTRTVRSAGQHVATAIGSYGPSGGTELAKSASLQLLTWDNPDTV